MYADILKTTGNYSDDETRLFERVATIREISKTEFLIRKGEVARSIYYLLSGAVWQFEVLTEETQNVIDLHIAGEWFLNYESLIAQKPSKFFIEAFKESQVLEVSLEAIHYLTGKSVAFLQLNRVLEGAVKRMQFFDQSMTPAQKYLSILDQRPALIQAFPLKMIASYLKISPETLSRVRNAIANGTIS